VLASLACPRCDSADLRPADDLAALAAPFDVRDGLRCSGCGGEFPIVDSVFVLWSDAVKALQLAAPPSDADLGSRVKRANIEVYDAVSEAYCEHSDSRIAYRDQILFLKAIARERATPGTRRGVMVDVGCGPGVGLEVGAGLWDDVIGLDLSLSNLRQVARRGFIAVLGDAERLPFRAGAVDTITCFGAMHHFPDAAAFVRSASRALRPGGSLLTGLDPSTSAMTLGPLARVVWDLRKPIYRAMAPLRRGKHLHSSRDLQERNDLAEHQRTLGGFDRAALRELFDAAGLLDIEVFYGVDREGAVSLAAPNWKEGLLQALSLRNPLAYRNWAPLTAVGAKPG
jgi:SAM-dependent methyltransferase